MSAKEKRGHSTEQRVLDMKLTQRMARGAAGPAFASVPQCHLGRVEHAAALLRANFVQTAQSLIRKHGLNPPGSDGQLRILTQAWAATTPQAPGMYFQHDRLVEFEWILSRQAPTRSLPVG